MKKPATIALLSVGIAAILFLAGIFVGRNSLPAPSFLPAQAIQPASTNAGTHARLLNINTADIWQLQQLPGIGEMLAQRIVDYRSAHGSFTSLEQLLDVDGIGSAKLQAIIEFICLED